jgi:GT2 family glycosyltransferase/glycosyltransferase involved in cell wall biosynthesis
LVEWEAAANPRRKEIPDVVRLNYPLTKAFLDRIKSPSPEAPQVSIVIISYRRPDLVENLIRSIWLHTHGFRYEIIVVDNGSPIGEHDLKPEFLERVSYIRLDHNQYIGDAYNIGVESARAPYLVLMNNDIVVEPDWLGPLIRPLVHDQDVGATGPRFLYPTGQLQEAGALIDEEGYSIQLGKRGDAEAQEFNQRREIDYCTGATIAMRRDFYIDSLGYDWRWSPGYYEDVDLCFKLRERGQGVFYIPESTVFHIESATMSEMPPSPNLASVINVNRRKLVAKWRHVLGRPRAAQNLATHAKGEMLKRFEAIRRPLDTSRKTLAIYLPFELIPGGGEKFALSIAEEFAQAAEIVVIFNEKQSILRFMSVTAEMGFGSLPFKCMTLEESRAVAPFDVFILLGNELFPSKNGLGRRNYFICQFPFPVPHEYLSCHEHKADDYECYIVYSQYVRRHVRARLDAWRRHKIPIGVLSPTADDIGLGDVKKINQIIGVGRFFVGGHNKRHDIMIDALNAILEKDSSIDLKLCLVGASHKEPQHLEHLAKLREKARDLPVEFYVDELREKLNVLYRQSKIYYHAAGWGIDPEKNPEQAEHFGISIIEAMSAGCVPIVYSLGGPIEIVKHGVNGIAVGSVLEMADWTTRLLRTWDSPQVREMRHNALATAKAYGKAAFGSRVHELISLDEVQAPTHCIKSSKLS